MKALLGLLLACCFPVFAQTDDHLKINKTQVIGSHNSYKQAIDPLLFKAFTQKDSAAASSIDYEHIPITAQLDLGLRNLEIDVYPDEKGGKYANPKGLEMVAGQKPYDPEGKMKQPGFKVLHVPDLDFRTHYFTLIDCLQGLKAWSDAHPDHTPVYITLEVKGEIATDGNTEGITAKDFDNLDEILLEHLGEKHILTPNQVTGKFESLESAVLNDNWPTLKEAKGKFVFVLDDSGSKRDMYISGHPSLRGRTMFANALPGTPEAAFLIRNNAKASEIPGLVKKGYLIRTRADSDTREARRNDKTTFEAACQSGAQIITTDYYQKSTHFNSDYSVSFEGSTYFRKNPLF
ncbi:phosphatidylinositol-specific phospholipase C1-like protein [Dyadobacter sp. CY347]|uniref:phosphatidylinositol-specific phospholipase C1-like protein n=1 Tax=Dyadobacter sp. CY347 TaxID=2909336 RepID=UPI001F26CDDF|nr:phosphatidylinositol-specific phospholipase C1-like protein [Dyadobacter sp. CY347]MCF2489054.1 phosphatidylinositol-specific phospholipase C1-like protein [Dyadobacter sp. CY347]